MASVVVAASFVAVALAAQSPKQRLASILSNARAQHSVHYTSWDSLGAAATGIVDADVSRDRGIAHLRTRSGSKFLDIATVILVHDTVYIRGRANALQTWLELPRAKTSAYGGRWISIPAHDKLYRELAAGVTLRSFIHGIAPLPHSRITILSTTIDGEKRIEIDAKGSWEQRDLLLRPGSRLPVAAAYGAGGGEGSTNITRWNESVHVVAPAHAIPIATVRGR